MLAWNAEGPAAACWSADLINVLVGAGAAVDAADQDGATPLHYAADLGNLAAAEALLLSSAAPNSVSATLRTQTS